MTNFEPAKISPDSLDNEQVLPNAIAKIGQQFIDLCKETNADSALVMHKGELISEFYSPNFQAPVAMMSCLHRNGQ